MGLHLSTFYDIFSNGYTVEYLDVLSIIALFFAITVIINKNPIASLMSLIGLFASISIYLILLGLTFIGFSYLIVYIGAVSILFLFILMLINIRTSELQSNNFNSIPLALFVTILLNYALQPILPYYMAIINSYNKSSLASESWLAGWSPPTKGLVQLLNNLIYYLSTSKYSDIVAKGEVSGSELRDAHGASEGWGDVSSAATKDLNTANVMFVTSNNWDGNMTETSHMSTIGNILYTSYNIWLFIASVILLLAMTGAIIITIKQDTDKQ